MLYQRKKRTERIEHVVHSLMKQADEDYNISKDPDEINEVFYKFNRLKYSIPGAEKTFKEKLTYLLKGDINAKANGTLLECN